MPSLMIGRSVDSFILRPITDVGSGARCDLSLWRADFFSESNSPYFYLGYYPTGNYNSVPVPSGPQFVFQSLDDNGNTCLAPPVSFNTVWRCVNNDQPSNLGIYGLQAPDGYIAIGSIAVPDFNCPPQVTSPMYSKLMCVRQDLCVQVTLTPADVIWTDQGSGASDNVIVWLLPNSKTCYAASCSGDYNENAIAWDVAPGFLVN